MSQCASVSSRGRKCALNVGHEGRHICHILNGVIGITWNDDDKRCGVKAPPLSFAKGFIEYACDLVMGHHSPHMHTPSGMRWSDMYEVKFDDVVRPRHYVETGLEPITVIEAWGLGFCLGNLVKYVARCGRKRGADPIEDLKKCRWYLEREIKNREKDLHSEPVAKSEETT